jgi:uncharacterized protein YvpB
MGAVIRRVGGLAVALVLLAGCNDGTLPTTGPAATKTPVSTPAVLDLAGVMSAGNAAFPPVPGGTSYEDCSFDGTLSNCALTDRLHARLTTAKIGLCNCGPSPDRIVTAELADGRGIAHIKLFGGRLQLDLVVVPVGTRLLVDDELLTGGGPETSIYASDFEIPEPKVPDDPQVRPGRRPQDIFATAVPVYAQTMNLDCETGALQMALAALGQSYTQPELFALEKPDLRPAVVGPDNTVLRWGNPYANFVGDVNGLETNLTGYGVYSPVIVAIARSHGAPGTIGFPGMLAENVYDALWLGHPVEVWVNAGWVRPPIGTWTAWDGQLVPYTLDEHAVTLSGVSTDSVRVNDPLHGTQYWVKKTTFEANWRDFGNQAVIFQ